MHPDTLDVLRCPNCAARLSRDDETLVCAGCGRRTGVVRDVARFVTPDEGEYVRSFGRQWNRYDVQHIEEDEATFEAKTGVRLAELAGLRVLDAGCGGGRYSHVAGRAGAHVVGVDLSTAVDRARRLCAGMGRVDVLQADLLHLPLAPESFDFVFSIGVLHHSPDTHQSFRSVARCVRPGGRLSVWLYRRNTFWQEAINQILRGVTTRLSVPALEGLSVVGAVLGGVPIVRSTLNKVANFSSHPCWTNRVCDTFDWYSPEFQHHHTIDELTGWFASAGFERVRVLAPERRSPVYDWVYNHSLLIGSGVNVTGIRS